MNFDFSPELMAFRALVRKFVRDKVEPRANQIEEDNAIPEELVTMCKDMGLFGISIPEEYGGLGLDMVGKCGIIEELAKTHNGFTTLLSCHAGIGSMGIVDFGNAAQKAYYLPKMATGEYIGAFALTEPSAGSNAANLKTTAVRDGDSYVLNGAKHYITNALDAQVFTVMAVTDPSKGAKGITSFIVERGTPGFDIGAAEKKLGLRGSHSAELFFDNVRIPVENRLGPEGEGYINALKILANGLVTLTELDDSEEKLVNTDGHALPGMSLAIVDASFKELPRNEEGSLLVKGPALFVGYLNQLDKTIEEHHGDWFITGDLAVMDDDGYIRISGRSKDIIIRGGENILVAYVENVLYEHPDIFAAQIVAMPDPRLQERAAAIVMMNNGYL